MLKNMKKAFAFLFAVTAAIQFVTVSFTITADASELTEYFIDTSGYTNADDVFNKYSSKLKRQNYTENGGQVYEAKGDMIRITNKEEVNNSHICMDFFGNWQQTSENYSKLRLTFKMSTSDTTQSKNVVARFYHYQNDGKRTGIFDDTVINFDTDGNMKCSMKTIEPYELNRIYTIDYIVDLKSGYRRLYIDDKLAAEETEVSIAKYGNSDYMVFNNARFQYVAKKGSDGKYIETEVAYGDIGYKYYDSCTRFIDNPPYIEENYIAFSKPVFVSDTEGETDISDYVPYDVHAIKIQTEGNLSKGGISADMFALKSDKMSVPIKEATYSDDLLVLEFDPLNMSKTDWTLIISGEIVLANGNKTGRDFKIAFKTGPKPFDITSVTFSKTGKLNSGERASADVIFRNITGETKNVTVIIMSYSPDGRMNGMKAKSAAITKDNQIVTTDDIEVLKDNSEIRAYVINSWANPISIDNMIYTNN